MRTSLFARYGTLLVWATVCGSTALWSQTNISGLQNNPFANQTNWKSVSSDHFDVHYLYDDPVMAQSVVKFAENALWDHCRLLDFNTRSRYALYLYGGAEELSRSNQYPMPIVASNGVTPIRTNCASVVFDGSYGELQKTVGREVAKLLMEDFYFGGGIQASVQNTVLLHVPEWYGEGLPAYLGEGWDYTDEMWLTSLENTSLLGYALEGNGIIHHVARKSIWFFIETQYGREKLAEIFYMTRLARGVEDGIVHVLGITLKTLTERWREFVLQRITENATFREKITTIGNPVLFQGKGSMVGAALNPVGPWAAVGVMDGGRFKLHEVNLERGVWTETNVGFGQKTEQLDGKVFQAPMCWSPDGKQLVLVGNEGRGAFMIVWSRESGASTRLSVSPKLDDVTSIDWSHDGKKWVVSGLKGGQLDLYWSVAGGNSFQPLTDDIHDDTDPIFSQDDQRIYFATTKQVNDAATTGTAPMDASNRSRDIWEIDLSDGSSRQITRTPWADERPQGALNGFELLLLTNQSGIWNLERRNVFTGDSICLSNFYQGMEAVDVNPEKWIFWLPVQGKLALFQTASTALLKEQVVLKTPFRLKQDKIKQAALRALIQNTNQDTLQVTLPPVKPPVLPPVTDSSRINYYVFDEDDSPKPRRNNNRPRAQLIKKTVPEKPDFSVLPIKSPRASTSAWAADKVTAKVVYDPVFRFGAQFDARLRDHVGNHALSAGYTQFMDLRSSDVFLKYQNNKHRVDFWTQFENKTRFLNRFDFSLRTNDAQIEGGAILPWGRFWSADVSTHLVRLNRVDLDVQSPNGLDGTAWMTGLKAGVSYEKVQKNGLFAQRGTYLRLEAREVFSLSELTGQFSTLSWDARKYIPLGMSTFASRFSGALSLGNNPQRFFLGGTEDWLFGRFNNPEDYPIGADIGELHYFQYGAAIRGFRFNARNGARNFVYNAELRIPVSRIMKQSLPNDPLYKVELIPFFDVGTAWTNGNPFSQRNPINTETIDSYPVSITVQTLKSPFIMGFGAGARAQVFGYNVRMDLAWGVEDYTVQKPLLHLSLGKNF